MTQREKSETATTLIKSFLNLIYFDHFFINFFQQRIINKDGDALSRSQRWLHSKPLHSQRSTNYASTAAPVVIYLWKTKTKYFL
jgi:hypothetical protein